MREAPWLFKSLIVNGDGNCLTVLKTNKRPLPLTFDQPEAREENVLNFVMNECPPISQNTGRDLAQSHLGQGMFVGASPYKVTHWFRAGRACHELERRDGAIRNIWALFAAPTLHFTQNTQSAPRLIHPEIQINDALVHFNYQAINHRIARNLLLLVFYAFQFCK